MPCARPASHAKGAADVGDVVTLDTKRPENLLLEVQIYDRGSMLVLLADHLTDDDVVTLLKAALEDFA